MTVLDLQRRLKALGFDPGRIDGVNGKETKRAVIAFQDAFGLVADGIVGKQMRKALNEASTPAKPGRPEPDKSAINGPTPAIQSVDVDTPRAANRVELLDTARQIKELIWHCTATPEGKDFTVADVRAWHKQRGWSDIGYHYVVYRDGRIMAGRPIGQTGAHVEGHNAGTVGCSYIGGLSADGRSAKDTRTLAQVRAMNWLTRALAAKFPIAKVTGHNQYAAKACPSFDVRKDPLGRIV